MRILIDECVPRRLLAALEAYDAFTVPDMGWQGKKNGELLRLMREANVRVFITIDQNLQYQQNLSESDATIIVLSAASNRYQDLLPLLPALKKRLIEVKPGQLYSVSG